MNENPLAPLLLGFALPLAAVQFYETAEQPCHFLCVISCTTCTKIMYFPERLNVERWRWTGQSTKSSNPGQRNHQIGITASWKPTLVRLLLVLWFLMSHLKNFVFTRQPTFITHVIQSAIVSLSDQHFCIGKGDMNVQTMCPLLWLFIEVVSLCIADPDIALIETTLCCWSAVGLRGHLSRRMELYFSSSIRLLLPPEIASHITPFLRDMCEPWPTNGIHSIRRVESLGCIEPWRHRKSGIATGSRTPP